MKLINKIESTKADEEDLHYIDELIKAHPEWELEVIDFDSYKGVYSID